jgi:predicted membrane protein
MCDRPRGDGFRSAHQFLIIGSEPETLMDTASLLWGLLFSSIGLGFFIYGKKQRAVVPLVCGLVLMIFPYFVPNTLLLVAIGAVLVALPYFLRY